MTSPWDPQKHPRAPAGSPGGGKFTSGSGGASSSSDAEINAIIAGARAGEKHSGGAGGSRGHSAKQAAKGVLALRGVLMFDPHSGTGTGYGRADARVKRLQDALTRLGITDGKGAQLISDGKYGPQTAAAVERLQQRLGVKADGRVTPALLAHIEGLKELPPVKVARQPVRLRPRRAKAGGVALRILAPSRIWESWDSDKHPRGFHGHFVHLTSDRGGEGGIRAQLAAGNRSPLAFQPRQSGAARRATKRAVQIKSELPRGVRQPRDWRERSSLEWQSPKKRAEQLAKTGDVLMPRRDALRAARRSAARSTGAGFADKTVGTKKTFTGKTIRVRGVTPDRGVRPTARGAHNLKQYSPDDSRLRPRATASPPSRAVLETDLKSVRGRSRLEAIAKQHGVAVSPLDTDAAIRRKILAVGQ